MKKLAFLLIVLLIACESSTAPDTQEMTIERYFPLTIGNTWVYKYEDGNLDTIEVISSYPYDNETIYMTNNYTYYYYKNDILKQYIYDAPQESNNYYIPLKEPIEVGNKWEWILDSHYPTDTLRITQVDVTISIEAGSFKNSIEIESVKSDKIWIYALDVGLIKVIDLNPAWNTNKELIWYDLGG